jgi:hypothetical protein
MLFGNKLLLFYFGHYVNEEKGLNRLPMNAMLCAPLYVSRPLQNVYIILKYVIVALNEQSVVPVAGIKILKLFGAELERYVIFYFLMSTVFSVDQRLAPRSQVAGTSSKVPYLKFRIWNVSRSVVRIRMRAACRKQLMWQCASPAVTQTWRATASRILQLYPLTLVREITRVTHHSALGPRRGL